MKKHIWMGGILAGMLMACSPQSQKMEGQIDILPAFENLTELKVSHLGKNIRYVPLETTDSSLIGSGCKIKLLGDKIVASYGNRGESHCFLFDRETGKFLREIGHKGNDPRGYNSPIGYVHPVSGDIYFQKQPNKLIKYNQDGEFLGEVEIPGRLNNGFYPLLTKEGMLVYGGETFNSQTPSQLYYLDEAKGKTGDVALPGAQDSDTVTPDQINGLSVYAGLGAYGLLGYTGAIKIEFKNGTQGLYAYNYPAVWSMEDHFHFHEALGDTIYQVKGTKLEPYRIFNLGERKLLEEEHGKKEGNEEKLAIAYVMETPDLIYFQSIKNIYGDLTVYNGLYRKSDESVMMSPMKEAFKDDLTGFAPFTPVHHTPKGEFVGTLTIEQIQEWQEEHPEVKLEGALASLKNLDFDANPVVVIVEP